MARATHSFSIIRKNGRLPRLPFVEMKTRILGKRYAVNLVVVGDRESARLNRRYRKKPNPANVLTFRLSKDEGEILMNPREIRRERGRFGMEYRELCALIFIHALLHLKGTLHGSKMEKEELRLLRVFIPETRSKGR